MNLNLSRTIFTALASVLFWLNSFSQIICARSHISGFEKEHEIGNVYNGGTSTTSPTKSKIYISVKEGIIYIQSNFKPTEAFEYPIKLATPPPKGYSTLEDYLANIFFFESEYLPEPSFASKFFQDIKKNIEIVVDPTVLNSSDFSQLGFENYTKLKIACPDNTAREVKILKDKLGKAKEFLIKSNNHISIRIKNQNLNIVTSDIKNIRRDPKKLKLISLIENSATQQLIAKEFAENQIKINYSKVVLKSTLIKNKGNLTILLGHIENEKFVTIDKAGKVLFEIELREIVDLQKKNNLELLLIGCNSGANSGTGALNKFNSIDFLSKLKFAKEADNMEDFLNRICEDNFDFVIDETFFIETNEVIVDPKFQKQIARIDLEVYNRGKGNKIYKPAIGKIILLNTSVNQKNAFQNDSTEYESNFGSEIENSSKKKNDNNYSIYIILGIGVIIIGYIFFDDKKQN